jgi:AcrR family transcriptional regulator
MFDMYITMWSMENPARSRSRRGAHTPRGQLTRDAILAAARQMCREQWLDQLSLAELARVAGTTRASVLFQFPEGWLDIAAEILVEEMIIARAATEEIAKLRLKPPQRLSRSVHYFLQRGEELGALMPNIRAFNYFWGDMIDALVAPARDAAFDAVARLLQATAPGRQSVAEARDASETLVFFAIDLACAPMYRRLRPAERAAKLDTAIGLVVKGLTRN